MSTISTFGTFTMARLGIYASQKALDVTGNNIANVNTVGYTRQRVDQYALKVGGADRYRSLNDVRVGNGPIIPTVSQLRDPYLDIRYRYENASVGMTDENLYVMNQLAEILDEVGDGTDGEGVLEAQFNDLMEQLQNLANPSVGTGRDDADTIVRSSASTLAKLFNQYAEKLQKLEETQTEKFEQSVNRVNVILNDIRDLNRSIRKSQLHGAESLEQMDQRNLLIDELSGYMRISVTTEQEEIGEGLTIDKLVIRLDGNDDENKETNNVTLVDGVYATQVSVIKQQQMDENGDPIKDELGNFVFENDPNLDMEIDVLRDYLGNPQTGYKMVTVTDSNGNPVQELQRVEVQPRTELKDNAVYGSLQAAREMLTEQGEFATQDQIDVDKKATIKRGIPYYQKVLDVMAGQFAKMMNDANLDVTNGKWATMEHNGVTCYRPQNITDLSNKLGITEDEVWAQLKVGGEMSDALRKLMLPDAEGGEGLGVYEDVEGGALISTGGNNDITEGITAANISISKSWSSGATRILESRKFQAGSTDNDNITHILSTLMNKDIAFRPGDATTGQDSANKDTVFFQGSFQGLLTNTWQELSVDMKTNNELYLNYTTTLDELYTDRDGVSGVDLNDEAMNMMQYQKSYSAACRLMTTIDEMIDKLINGTGRAGL